MLPILRTGVFPMVTSPSDLERAGMVGRQALLTMPVFRTTAWFCKVGAEVSMESSLAWVRRGVIMALLRSEGDESREEESSLKSGGSGIGSGVGLASERGYAGWSLLVITASAGTVIWVAAALVRCTGVVSAGSASFMRFFLFFLASATAAGPFDMAIRASVVDLGRAVGSEGIVGLEGSGSRGGVRVVQFSHFSVKEYLTSSRLARSPHGEVSRFRIDLEPAHTIMAQACLATLLRLDEHAGDSDAKVSPLVKYAAKHWVDHAQFGKVSSRVRGGMNDLFDSSKPHFAAWLQVHDIDEDWYAFSPQRRDGVGSPLYYAAFCGFYDLAEHLITSHPEQVNARGGCTLFPLPAA